MQQLITSYLFQHKTCPLPGLGTLSVIQSSAESDFLNKQIKAPQPSVIFEGRETEASALVDFIAGKLGIPVMEAIDALGKYCNQLKTDLSNNNVTVINLAGSLSSGAQSKINFKPAQLNPVFLPPVNAERVIHPDAQHTMLVGDKETTNTEMADYYSETTVTKNYWWLWALVLAVLALIGLVLYYNDASFSPGFGNISPL